MPYLQIKKANHRNVIEYITNKTQTLLSRPSPDTEKEFWRETTTKASSQIMNDITVFEKKRYNSGNQNSYGYGYGKYKAGNIVQQSGIFLCSSSGGSKTHFYTSLHKKLILCKKKFNCAISRKVKQLYRELENSDKRYINSVVITELCKSISQNSPTGKHPKLSQIKPRRKDSSAKGNSRDAEQESKCRDLKPLGMGIYQQPFFS